MAATLRETHRLLLYTVRAITWTVRSSPASMIGEASNEYTSLNLIGCHTFGHIRASPTCIKKKGGGYLQDLSFSDRLALAFQFFFQIQLIIVAESAGIYSKAMEAHCTGIERPD